MSEHPLKKAQGDILAARFEKATETRETEDGTEYQASSYQKGFDMFRERLGINKETLSAWVHNRQHIPAEQIWSVAVALDTLFPDPEQDTIALHNALSNAAKEVERMPAAKKAQLQQQANMALIGWRR